MKKDGKKKLIYISKGSVVFVDMKTKQNLSVISNNGTELRYNEKGVRAYAKNALSDSEIWFDEKGDIKRARYGNEIHAYFEDGDCVITIGQKQMYYNKKYNHLYDMNNGWKFIGKPIINQLS